MNVLDDPSAQREEMVRRLRDDLIGPREKNEFLEDRPSDTYLTGILWPAQTQTPGEEDDRLSVDGTESGKPLEDAESDQVPAKSITRPSTAGVSFCASSEGEHLVEINIEFGIYERIKAADTEPGWQRVLVRIDVPAASLEKKSQTLDLSEYEPKAVGARLHIRAIDGPDGRLATATLINGNESSRKRNVSEGRTFFQTQITISGCGITHLVPRPSTEGHFASSNDSEDRSNALLFRNVVEFAAGHTCSAEWQVKDHEGGRPVSAEFVRSTWIPGGIVPDVSSAGHEAFAPLYARGSENPLAASPLASASAEDLESALRNFTEAYETWIKLQEERLEEFGGWKLEAANSNLKQCRDVLVRMNKAIVRISAHERIRQAFQLANLAMDVQFDWAQQGSGRKLVWRPFQLAFLLLAAESTVDRQHPDRAIMDLLWFPTGGGKTEAYLGLIALLIFYRRLSDDPDDHAGVVAIMRYTLRLLTTQQFARAASMISACDAIRRGRLGDLGTKLAGDEPISIGLWVGNDATPNKRTVALASLKGSKEVSSPEQLAKCPACHSELRWDPDRSAVPITCECTKSDCLLYGNLPVFTVDDDIYDFRPSLVIATIDKFAQIVRNSRTGTLFGVHEGRPPDLVIQDELHLISGPLGTIAGLYETAIDLIFSARGTKPKIIGSTATIRKAEDQVLALFDRDTCQFPPPGLDHRDSGFAVWKPVETASPGREYVGISTAGRSAKFALQAVAGSLLQSAVSFRSDNERDLYWTLLGYFNSLRELGGALVLMQDDVSDSVKLYADARNEDAREVRNVEELTSRRTQDEILDMLEQLEIPCGKDGAVDTVLATNMVSVGVDIGRLGLMVVTGQPKTTSEYIQATSRVGRSDASGLVVTILNNAKARDRSHFETFAGWHQALYRDVEATSVTPFASRARDRALHAALVAAVRHLVPGMLDERTPGLDDEKKRLALKIVQQIAERAARIDSEEKDVEDELEDRLDEWEKRSLRRYWDDYKPGTSLLQGAEKAAKKRSLGRNTGEAWPTMNTMRSVEVGTPFRLAERLRPRR